MTFQAPRSLCKIASNTAARVGLRFISEHFVDGCAIGELRTAVEIGPAAFDSQFLRREHHSLAKVGADDAAERVHNRFALA